MNTTASRLDGSAPRCVVQRRHPLLPAVRGANGKADRGVAGDRPETAPRAALRTAPGWGRTAVALCLFGALAQLVATPALGQSAPARASAATAAPSVAALRVCADPGDLPFSNKAGQGFENKLATMLGRALDKRIEYTWGGGAGLHQALAAHRCDVILGWPASDPSVLATQPYYRSTYVLVYRRSAPYTIRSLDNPVLKKLVIGVREIGDQWTGLPGGAMLASHDLQGSAKPYPLHGNTSAASPSLDLIKAVANGDVDAAIAWGPPAGYFARREKVKLVIVPLTHVHLRVPTRFSISMAVRKGDNPLRHALDRFLRRHRAAIHALLADYGVPLLPLDGSNDAASVATR